MNRDVPPEKFRLLGGGNDDLGAIQLIATESKILLTTTSLSTPYLKYVLVLGMGAFLFGSIALLNPGSDLLSWRGVLFFSPVFIFIWAMTLFSDWYMQYRESAIMPLLEFNGSTLVRLRGEGISMDGGAIELYLIHAFNSSHGEVVELQLHEVGNSSARRLVVSLLPGDTQYVMKKHLSRIGESKGINTYFVKTDGPQGKRPFDVKSTVQLTGVPNNPMDRSRGSAAS
jgi:hypothetical protein